MITKKVTPNRVQGKICLVLCFDCNKKTNHKVILSFDEDWKEVIQDSHSIDGSDSYQIIQCQGCSEYSFRHLNYFSERWDIGTGESNEIELLYPKRKINDLSIKEYDNVPSNLQRIYEETITCFNNENLTLCGAGVRAIVEGLCKENGITGGKIEIKNEQGEITKKRKKNLQGKINGLFEAGKLTKEYVEILHEHRFLGNTAIHELSISAKNDLRMAIEIVESVFISLYEVPEKGSRLRANRESKEK